MTRFELATTRPPDVYSNRAELHPEPIPGKPGGVQMYKKIS